MRPRDPSVRIASVEESLDAFVDEKRTDRRQALQAVRAGRPISQLDPAARALLLEYLIECVYDERPDLSFDAAYNAPNNRIKKDAGDEFVLLKAGQDASGSSYYYMDGKCSLLSLFCVLVRIFLPLKLD